MSSLPTRKGRKEDVLDSFDVVRYLYLPGELEGGRRRATDPTWSLTTHYISEVSKSDGIIIYRLGPDIKSGRIAPKSHLFEKNCLKYIFKKKSSIREPEIE